MTIDEVIEQEKFRARVDRIKANKKIFHNNDEDEICACNRSAEEHEQLAEWLEELKEIKENQHKSLRYMYEKGYNKALNDAKSVILQTLDNEMLVDTLHLRLEQLKAGGTNGTDNQ